MFYILQQGCGYRLTRAVVISSNKSTFDVLIVEREATWVAFLKKHTCRELIKCSTQAILPTWTSSTLHPHRCPHQLFGGPTRTGEVATCTDGWQRGYSALQLGPRTSSTSLGSSLQLFSWLRQQSLQLERLHHRQNIQKLAQLRG
jgi:hypothetical protein